MLSVLFLAVSASEILDPNGLEKLAKSVKGSQTLCALCFPDEDDIPTDSVEFLRAMAEFFQVGHEGELVVAYNESLDSTCVKCWDIDGIKSDIEIAYDVYYKRWTKFQQETEEFKKELDEIQKDVASVRSFRYTSAKIGYPSTESFYDVSKQREKVVERINKAYAKRQERLRSVFDLQKESDEKREEDEDIEIIGKEKVEDEQKHEEIDEDIEKIDKAEEIEDEESQDEEEIEEIETVKKSDKRVNKMALETDDEEESDEQPVPKQAKLSPLK